MKRIEDGKPKSHSGTVGWGGKLGSWVLSKESNGVEL
jgi:hypothetical protein